jgi:hypothetical protein
VQQLERNFVGPLRSSFYRSHFVQIEIHMAPALENGLANAAPD